MIIDFKLCLSSKEIKMECEDNFVSVVCKGQALTGCIWKSSFLFRYRSAKRVFSAQTLTNFPQLRWPWLAFLFISFFRFFFCRKNNYWGILNKQKNILDFWFTPITKDHQPSTDSTRITRPDDKQNSAKHGNKIPTYWQFAFIHYLCLKTRRNGIRVLPTPYPLPTKSTKLTIVKLNFLLLWVQSNKVFSEVSPVKSEPL